MLLDTQPVSGLFLFFGRLHPLVVHLPIGFLLLAALFEFLGRKPDYASLRDATTFTLFLGAASAVFACIFGYFLSLEGGYDQATLDRHQWLGIVLSILAVLAWLHRAGRLSFVRLSPNKTVPVLLGLITLLLLITGHLGGSLTHGPEYLTQHLPFGGSSYTPVERPPVTNLDSADVYADVIQPIFEARCNSCHNPGKSKGKLILVSEGAILKGGKNGPVLQAGNPSESHLFQRVTLPLEDDKHMPPDGKKQLSDEQITLLNWWISEGAPFSGQLASMELPDEIGEVLREELGLDEAAKGLLAKPVAPLPGAVLDSLRNLGLPVSPISQDNGYLELNMAFSDSVITTSQLEALELAKDHLVWVNLAGLDFKNEDLSLLGNLPNLLVLHLENSSVNDEGVRHLSGLEHLEYLNLHSTAVTGNCLSVVKELPALNSLFLWQTEVPFSSADSLRKAFPDLNIEMGVDPKVI